MRLCLLICCFSFQVAAAPSISGGIDKCRIQLNVLKNNPSASTFSRLFEKVETLLKEIDGKAASPEIYLLLGECQGVLQSIEFSLNRGIDKKTPGQSYGPGPKNPPLKQTNRQGTSRPDNKKREKLPSHVPTPEIDMTEEEKNKAYPPQPTKKQSDLDIRDEID